MDKRIPVCLFCLLVALNIPIAEGSPSGQSTEYSAVAEIALSEMQTIANALILAKIDTGFYVSLENLDDVINPNASVLYDYIGDGGGTPVIDPDTARFQAERRDLINAFNAWRGPYVTYQPSQADHLNIFGYDQGTPLDPWGAPYYLYTPVGLVRPPLDVTLEDYGDQFDRYAIVSYGPDWFFGGGDDLLDLFGSPPTRLTLTSIRPLTASRGNSITLKGYHFGNGSDGVALLFNGQVISDGIESWTDQEIRRTILSTDPPGEIIVRLRNTGGTVTLPIRITLFPTKTFSVWWTHYR